MFLSIVDSMQREVRQGRMRWGIALVLLLALGATAMVLFPRASRGPERTAGEFLEALIQTPADTVRLRAAARLTGTQDPQALLQGLSTGVTLNFLQARHAQGISQDIMVLERQQSVPQRVNVRLRVSEVSAAGGASPRDFAVQLEPITDGDWRVASLRAAD